MVVRHEVGPKHGGVRGVWEQDCLVRLKGVHVLHLCGTRLGDLLCSRQSIPRCICRSRSHIFSSNADVCISALPTQHLLVPPADEAVEVCGQPMLLLAHTLLPTFRLRYVAVKNCIALFQGLETYDLCCTLAAHFALCC